MASLGIEPGSSCLRLQRSPDLTVFPVPCFLSKFSLMESKPHPPQLFLLLTPVEEKSSLGRMRVLLWVWAEMASGYALCTDGLDDA